MTMTLEEAIAKVKRVTPKTDDWWEPGDIGGGPSPIDTHICTILNAVASGDLIPRTDAALAVALAYQRAGDAVADYPRASPDYDEWTRYDEQIAHSQAAILALAPVDALAEVQALKAERDSFRAVLEGCCYGDIDGIAKNSVEMSRMLGDAVMQMTKARLTRAEAAEAEVARLRGSISMALGKMHPSESLLAWNTLTAALTTPEKDS